MTTDPTTRSLHQDLALALCRAEYGVCPFACGKDGAPNCHANVVGYGGVQCEPGARTANEAAQLAAWHALQDGQR